MSPKKKSSRSNSTLMLIILLVVLGFGAYYSFTGRDLLGIFTLTETPPVGSEVDGLTSQPEIPPVSNTSSIS